MAFNASGKTDKKDGSHKANVVERGASERTVAERITVALIPKAGDDLQQLQDRTGLSKTDIVNRAISAYEFFESKMRDGNDLLIRDPQTNEVQIVKFL
ncbi:MAG: hypothetical protein ACRDOD_02520 [Streptosporangiaceae bacterium]